MFESMNKFFRDKITLRGAVEWSYRTYPNETGRGDWQLTAGLSTSRSGSIGV